MLGFVTPALAKYYDYLSGGEAQLPSITEKLTEISLDFRHNWFWICPLLILIPASLLHLAVRPNRDDGLEQVLIAFLRPGTLLGAVIIAWLLLIAIIATFALGFGIAFFSMSYVYR